MRGGSLIGENMAYFFQFNDLGSNMSTTTLSLMVNNIILQIDKTKNYEFMHFNINSQKCKFCFCFLVCVCVFFSVYNKEAELAILYDWAKGTWVHAACPLI